jgi:hypothetical protein
MKATTRTTHECSINDLDPALRATIRAHAAQYGLGEIESGILMCCQTTAIQPKTGLFGGSETVVSGIFVTPTMLVWAEGTNGKRNAGSAKLTHIDVHNYEDSALSAINPDMGLNITGRYTNSIQTGQTFIGLGADLAGKKFRQVLSEAMGKIKSN